MKKGLAADQIQEILDASPMMRFLGIRVDASDAENGTVTMTMPMRAELERLPGSGQFHGGALAGFVDIVGDFAIAVTLGGVVPTINLRVDYLRPASGAFVRASARTRRLGRAVGVVDIDVIDVEGRLVAVGRGTYSGQQA